MKTASPLANQLLSQHGLLLGEHGFQIGADPTFPQSDHSLIFYHYTYEDRPDPILSKNGGLYAYRPVACPQPPEPLKTAYLTEAFLEPLPKWLTEHAHFKNLGLQMVGRYIGTVLLRIEVPSDFPGLYVADFAHILECKYYDRHGVFPLGLGYNCQNGHHATQGYVNSYIPVQTYRGGHLAPVVQAVRQGPGIVIPSAYISVSSIQPLQSTSFS